MMLKCIAAFVISLAGRTEYQVLLIEPPLMENELLENPKGRMTILKLAEGLAACRDLT